MSYWNRPFFPEWCGDAILDDHVTYDTMVRIGGSFSGISRAFKAIADHYGWTHIVLLSDDNDTAICWYGGKPLYEILGNNENYTLTWLRFGSEPTDDQLDEILQQIRARTRGTSVCCGYYVSEYRESFLRNVSLLYFIGTSDNEHTTAKRKHAKHGKLNLNRQNSELFA